MRAFRFFNDLRLSEPFPSAVLLMGFLRIANSDARSSFSRQQLGRFWPVAKWLLASVAIWLLTVGKPSATETSSKNVDNGRSCAHYVGHNLVGYIKRVADSLGEFEQLVLTGVLLLGEHAYGLAMHAKISELAAPRNVRLGAVYMTLDRLKDKGLLRSWMSDPTPERGGRSKRLANCRQTGLVISVQLATVRDRGFTSKWRSTSVHCCHATEVINGQIRLS